MRSTLRALVLAVLVVTIPAVEAAQRPWAPAAVLAASVPAGAVVAWSPGEVRADYYNVYGVDGEQIVFLDIVVDTAFHTDSIFPSYAVSGVKDGLESERVYASFSPCLTVTYDPPNAWVGNCGVVVPIKVGTQG